MKKNGAIWPIIIALLFAGCGAGNTHTYHGANTDIPAAGTYKVAIATYDQRYYVVNGDKPADFVGLRRAKYGIPFDMETASGNPLAQDFTETISRSFAAKGFRATPVIVYSSDTNYKTVKANLKQTGAHRLILLILYEWKSDTFRNTSLTYNVLLEVFDENGRLIAHKRISGNDDLGGRFIKSKVYAKNAVHEAFKEKIELLLNDKNISKALE